MDRNTVLFLLVIGFLLFIMAKDRGLFSRQLTSNEETMDWIDYRGFHYVITMHRNLH